MSILKDIILIIPQDMKFNDNSKSITNVKDSKAFEFSNETSCISSFYTRLLPKINTNNIKRVIVECVENINEDKKITIGAGIATTQVYLNYSEYFSAEEDEKKRIASRLIKDGLIELSKVQGWDSDIFLVINNKIEEQNYKNIYIFKKKSSPNRQYVCNIICEHETTYFDISIEVMNKDKTIIKKKKIIREVPHPINFHQHLGEVNWELNNKIIYSGKFKLRQWIITL